jgi:SAM-dependent methyltransferase
MALWTDRIVPHVVEKSLSTGDVMKQRQRACGFLRGRVLEIGFGSGLNVVKYPDAVTEVHAVEPSDLAWQMSAARREASPVAITRSGLDGQQLDEPDASFDSVLSTFTLCTVPDVEQTLRELRRVLRPDGVFGFVEHGLAPDPGVVRWQRRLEPLQRRVAGGCHLTRDVPMLVDAAGFDVVDLDSRYLPGPAASRPWTYGWTACATPRRARTGPGAL